ncbi:MAG TPA: glutamine synthetase family protein [Polyangia bacterium]|nr:glutamine synthetase family protein [Polyangia bacterium]
MVEKLALTNPLSRMLDKERGDFTRADLLQAARKLDIERFTFRYTGGDGRLKELRLPFSSIEQADRILGAGERVDGSSLFKGFVDTGSSDLYVVPGYHSAFVNPFDATSLDFICRFLDRSGRQAQFTPDNILSIAHDRFRERTGLELWALGELEFFLIGENRGEHYTPPKQAGYHSSSPYFKSNGVVDEMLRHISRITGAVKYAHSEVGFIESLLSEQSRLAGRRAEQHEIEFHTRPIEEAGDFLSLAQWVIRNVAYRHGMLVTFAPKIEEGVAGNGFHVHMELVQGDRNVMTGKDGALSEPALKLIGGLTTYASTISAFGNTVASAYLRLVPHQEAPTRICWSDSNRSALIRVPLGWSGGADLARAVNPGEPDHYEDPRGRQTVEIRSPDGSARCHLLLAGLVTAAEHGLTAPGMTEVADRTRVTGNVFDDPNLLARLEALPGSCVAASRLLRERRGMYEEHGVFPPQVIDHVCTLLEKEDDENLAAELAKMPPHERLAVTRRLMHRDIHRH